MLNTDINDNEQIWLKIENIGHGDPTITMHLHDTKCAYNLMFL